ncbi:citrate lyase holo-[acyl-carrier protein] synthase [Levilactobacillus suantsaii]|uniref:citrate lyase holo-[acyl-carrier protein] synthase n=1 Tax=Levilactobacillus suantsaii TaxID=2292255 RepID=UPI0015F52A96|nr:citrate lyase holo-[acyl-carrier protein] synthase [Levilactobacillus suantsaii]QMU08654.1 citrate lyase holo-[acyl-carrier protein] synthase [Levilactobacillus suantsaii]
MTPTTFATGDPQDIAAVLANKDHRAAYQRQLMTAHPDQTVLALKLNTPGPIKNNARITAAFDAGLAAFTHDLTRQQVTTTLVDRWDNPTGPEAFLLSATDATTMKQLAVAFEDQHPLGRLFDIDVLTSHHEGPLSRQDNNLPQRRCFICNRPAKVCARSRAHSVLELQTAIDQTLTTYFTEQESKQ